jgi:hypothetical protein
MSKALLSLHVHLLGWLTHLPGDEIDQIIVGRFVMLACLSGTCLLLYALARTFFSPVASLVAVLAFASSGYTMVHGASFRADPMAAAFIMLSLALMARCPPTRGWALLAGVAAAVAGMITIKVVLYAPAFIGVAVWRLRTSAERRRIFWWLGGIAAAAAAAFAGLYLLQLGLVDRASIAATQASLNNAAQTTLLGAGLLPRLRYIGHAALVSPVQTLLLGGGLIGVSLAIVRARGDERMRLFAIACCAANLLCLLFYRNAFPYFFPFILPPAMLLAAWVIDWSPLLKRPSSQIFLSAALLIPAMLVAYGSTHRPYHPQRAIVSAVHQIFPQPVKMIDHSHMIGSFPKRGFFMSTWGMANYRAGKPIFAGILARETVPLLLLDHLSLAEAVGAEGKVRLPPDQILLDEDRAILSQNYVPHWGPIWVAGKRLHPLGPSGAFDILIPGPYTLEGGTMIIDGKRVIGGDVVVLGRGRHRFETQSRDMRVLRWGKKLAKPAAPAPPGPRLFNAFF